MASAPDPITSPPDVAGQPWDATDSATVAGWTSVDGNSGPANMQGTVSGDFDSGPGPWKQT
jgi:hypothetical protein